MTVLGAGRQASVLITANHRRILIAAGTNGSAFSNAIGEALPPIAGEFELVLLDPGASQDVQQRARALGAKLFWVLPAPDQPLTSDTIERPFTIDLAADTRLDIRIDPEGAWNASLASSAGVVSIEPGSVRLPEPLGPVSVAVFTHETDDVDVVVPLLIGVPGITSSTAQELRVVAPGSMIRLELEDGEIRTNAIAHQLAT